MNERVLASREADIMAIVWDLGVASAEDVRNALPHELHDSTVRTMLRILELKGYLKHTTRGRRYLYEPAVPRDEIQRGVLSSFLRRFFGGSGRALLLRLIDEDHVTLEDLQEAQRLGRSSRRGRKTDRK
jgi:predicted transcriptional regulator